MQGIFILAGNHLGNPDDIPPRSLLAVKEADLVIFEEDRVARQVLKAAGVHRDYLLYSEHKQALTREDVSAALKAGKTVVYMSDQGMPNVADPGSDLLGLARAQKAIVKVIPGPSSVTSAIAACPFVTGAFRFGGFLPRDEQARAAAIKGLVDVREPIVLLDTPYRLVALLESFAGHFPGSREIMVALDISGPDEDYILGSAKEVLQKVKVKVTGTGVDGKHKKLNFVLVVSNKR